MTRDTRCSAEEPVGLDAAAVVVVAAAAVGRAAVAADADVQGLGDLVRAEKKERGLNSFCERTFSVFT